MTKKRLENPIGASRAGRRREGERGIALLFTLGMLGLLLALALAFAADAMSERKAAAAAGDQACANMLARSALARVVAGMNWYTQAGVSLSDFYSKEPATYPGTATSNPNANTFDRIWRLASSSFLPFSGGAMANCPSWQYVTNGRSDAKNEIIGRFAYMFSFGSGGKLDPSACLSTEHNESYSANHSNVFGWETRRGVDVSEINLMNLNAATNNTDYLTSDQGIKISFSSTGGQLANGSRWLDFDDLFSKIGLSDSGKKAKLKSVFQLNSAADPEAFWLDTDKSGTKDASKYFHRFNLARGDWDKDNNPLGWPNDSTPYKDTDGDNSRQVFFNMLLSPSQQYQGTTPGVSSGISWLANWENPGEMGSAEMCRAQIAANLMDYCGKGFTVTSGDSTGKLIKPSDWLSSPPSFVGLKATPLLNEVAFEIKFYSSCSSYTSGGKTYYKYTYNIDPRRIWFEIIDLYGGAQSSYPGKKFTDDVSTTKISYGKAKVSFAFMTSSGSYGAESSVDIALTGQPSFSNSWNGGYRVLEAPSLTVYKSGTTTLADSSDLTHDEYGFTNQNKAQVKIKIQMPYPVVLSFAGSSGATSVNNVQYCVPENPLNLNNAYLDSGAYQAGDGQSRYAYFSFQADDPRMALRPSDWLTPATLTPQMKQSSTFELGQSFNNYFTVGLSNVLACTCLTASVRDPENSLDNNKPAYYGLNPNQHLSNAFIRNGVMPTAHFADAPQGMLSPAELGCIHRGARWQTLNLCYYRDVSANPTSGGGSYSEGDANILDQVKFTASTSTYGKVNLNTNLVPVLQALFANLFRSNPSNNLDPAAGLSRHFDPYTIRNAGTQYGQFEDLSAAKLMAYNSDASVASLITWRKNYFTDGVFKTRVQPLANAGLRNLLCLNMVGPKCVNEQFLCDFINLTKAEPDQISMVLVAQSIKDVGVPCQASGLPVSTGGLTLFKDWNGSGSATGSANDSAAGRVAAGFVNPSDSTQTVQAPSDWSSWPSSTISNCRKGVYENGADVITAERKYFVTLSYDSSNCKWRIISIQLCVN